MCVCACACVCVCVCVRYDVKGATDGSVAEVVWQFIDVRHRET